MDSQKLFNENTLNKKKYHEENKFEYRTNSRRTYRF